MIPGKSNSISVEVATKCGNDFKSINVNSVVVVKPIIKVTNPQSSNTNTGLTQQKIEGVVEKLTAKSQLTITVNGSAYTGFSFTNIGSDKFKFNGVVSLQAGVNTLVFTATHASGGIETITKTILVSSEVIVPNIIKQENTTPTKKESVPKPTREPIIR